MANAEKVGVNSLVQLKRILDVRRPEAVVRTIVEGQTKTAEVNDGQGNPVLDLSGLRNPIGRCSIGIEGSWSVSFPSAMAREALRRAGKEGAKPVTGAGTYRSGKDATEENFTLKVARSAEGLVAVSFSAEPTFATLTEKRLGHDFGRIPPTTLNFQSATRPGGVGGPA
jgi:hypothetical protein